MNDDDPWAEYARIQALADSDSLTGRTWAAEEALGAILDKIETRQEISAKQIDNLLTNRAATVRHRRHLLVRNALLFDQSANKDTRLEARLELDRHRRRCTPREWWVLYASAIGFSYASIGQAEHVPEGTVKTWVRRARLKLDRAA